MSEVPLQTFARGSMVVLGGGRRGYATRFGDEGVGVRVGV